jgi:hypothetical protein
MQAKIFNDRYGFYVYKEGTTSYNGDYLQPDGTWRSTVAINHRFETREDAENALQKVVNAKVFWMVWREEGNSPTCRHFTKEAAILESKRLAEKHPGVKFYVLMATGHAVQSKSEFVEY